MTLLGLAALKQGTPRGVWAIAWFQGVIFLAYLSSGHTEYKLNSVLRTLSRRGKILSFRIMAKSIFFLTNLTFKTGANNSLALLYL